MATINGGAVGLMTGFLNNGEGFDALWSNILPFVAESFLPLNEQMEANSILKSAVAKVEVDDAEMREIINACVAGMAEEALQNVIRLNMWEGISERNIADRTGMYLPPCTVGSKRP